jgi:hypothetical protein
MKFCLGEEIRNVRDHQAKIILPLDKENQQQKEIHKAQRQIEIYPFAVKALVCQTIIFGINHFILVALDFNLLVSQWVEGMHISPLS